MTAPITGQRTDTRGLTPEQLAGMAATSYVYGGSTGGSVGGGGSVVSGAAGGDVTRCLFAGGGAVLMELTAPWPLADTPLAALAGAALPDTACDVWIDLTGQHPLYAHGVVVQGTGAAATQLAFRYWDGATWRKIGVVPGGGAGGSDLAVDLVLGVKDVGHLIADDVQIAYGAQGLVRLRPFALGADDGAGGTLPTTALQLASLHVTARPGLVRAPAAAPVSCRLSGMQETGVCYSAYATTADANAALTAAGFDFGWDEPASIAQFIYAGQTRQYFVTGSNAGLGGSWGMGCANNFGPLADAWFRMRFRFPEGFVPATGSGGRALLCYLEGAVDVSARCRVMLEEGTGNVLVDAVGTSNLAVAGSGTALATGDPHTLVVHLVGNAATRQTTCTVYFGRDDGGALTNVYSRTGAPTASGAPVFGYAQAFYYMDMQDAGGGVVHAWSEDWEVVDGTAHPTPFSEVP